MVTLIAAMAKNRVIGKNNDLIWHIPKDLKRFKALTLGHPIVMGSKTFASLGNKPLPRRTNIVVSRNPDISVDPALLCTNLEDAVKLAKKEDSVVYIVGGGEIYRQALEFADAMELTILDKDFDGDTYFPQWNTQEWEEVSSEEVTDDPDVDYTYRFVRFERKN
ncbi:MAG: dihydrofolate reductase [Flavobacteriales bacterium]|nr:MAG: dihydrofolate reductase [Flavobacteriales bacterium]